MNILILVMLPENILGEHNYSHYVVRLSILHSFPGHNFVVCAWIKILFGANDRHNKTTCRAQNSSSYLQGQGHRATLKQINFRAITLLFMVEFRYCLVQLIILTR